MPDSNDQYEVGYGKPPAKNRFQKGASGNPKGRPKGTKNWATAFLNASRQRVLVNGPRGTRKVTMLEATAMQISTKSAKGDLRAARDFVTLVQKAEETAITETTAPQLGELDQRLLERLQQRFSRISHINSDSEGAQ